MMSKSAMTPSRSGRIAVMFAGVRPIIASGKGIDPSKERRDHAVWSHDGITTVSGGKLTTFRLIALDALLAAGLIDADDHDASQAPKERLFRFAANPPHRLGNPLAELPDGEALLEQVRWVLENEMVMHLDDLLLRRTRIGNLLPHGGKVILGEIKPLCQQLLGWDEAEWEREAARYIDIVERYYSVPQASPRVANAA